MKIRALKTMGVVVLSLCSSVAAWSTSRSSTVSCPVSGSVINSDLLSRGIVITGYAGNNISLVQLAYVADTGHAGSYSISLTARRGGFNGPIIGSTQTRTIDVGDLAGATYTFPFFDFGAAPVTPGDTVTFTHTYEDNSGGGGSLFFNNGGGSCPGVFQTDDTSPPFGHTVLFNSTAIAVSEVNFVTSCIPSDTVMCIDDAPGDHRFQVTSHFHTIQGGGHSGSGQEIPLAPLGVTHGGLFWFFGQDSPEVVFKMVNACALNAHWWVFISAGTNVGFSVTVTDTLFGGGTRTYSNPDLTAAVPVQDTAALGGCI